MPALAVPAVHGAHQAPNPHGPKAAGCDLVEAAEPLPISAITAAAAHVPYLEQNDFTAEQPFRCPSARQSIAVYAWLDKTNDVDFFSVTAYGDVSFFSELLVPVFEPYSEFRPSLALIGPGIDASHNYERAHMDALNATTNWIMAYLLD